VTDETLLILIAPPGRSTQRAADLMRAAQELTVIPVVLSGEDNAADFNGAHRLLLPAVPEVLSPIPYVVPLQLFAYFLAVGNGINPDLIHRDDERQRAARTQYV
jgi:glucosamine--fructose-6-phosphate aminotransferase (isomerizing)